MTKIIKNGIQYNVDPSVVNAKELLVTTPQVEVIASKQPYQQKQLQYILAHAYGPTQSERIQENKRNANIASNYFNSNPNAKQAINKIMNNADKLADQLQIDPNKIQVLRENLINVQGKTPIEAEQIIKDQLQYLKTGQETRARGLAAQEWIRDNHSVEVPQTVDNGVNFFTNESLRNVWRNMAVGIPLIWGYSRITQSH